MRARGAIGLVLLLALACAPLSAQQNPAAPTVRADQMDLRADNVLSASGNVQIVGVDFALRADSVELRDVTTAGQPSVEITAKGSVALSRGGERLTCERLEFNPLTGVGTFRLRKP